MSEVNNGEGVKHRPSVTIYFDEEQQGVVLAFDQSEIRSWEFV